MGFVEREAMPDEDARDGLRVQRNAYADLCRFEIVATVRNGGRVDASARLMPREAAHNVSLGRAHLRTTLATRSQIDARER